MKNLTSIYEKLKNQKVLNMTNPSTRKLTLVAKIFANGDYKTVVSFSKERKKRIEKAVSTYKKFEETIQDYFKYIIIIIRVGSALTSALKRLRI
ncbi:CLUMA_CG017094, isoform A [Clunio marinus]|uniref:CLUMA_CG017094, isoform A n=1 Tax=Clunio marinus TaxID=568069 RepID=A0A1J1IUT1_9DIPT|nr:CLUMA_CG017094, isoform A [Clunio marinus]